MWPKKQGKCLIFVSFFQLCNKKKCSASKMLGIKSLYRRSAHYPPVHLKTNAKNIKKTLAVPWKTPGIMIQKNILTKDFLTSMSFANHLSSKKCTVSKVDPHQKVAPSGGPVGFSFNARPNQKWIQSVHFGFSLSRAITAFTPLHIGYSAKQTKNGRFQEEPRLFWLQFTMSNQTKWLQAAKQKICFYANIQ